MNDVIARYFTVVSERHEPENMIEILVRGIVWDHEIRAAVWHIQELEVVYSMFRKFEQAERKK